MLMAVGELGLESSYSQFKQTVHAFFIGTIICTTLLLVETIMNSFVDYQRTHDEPSFSSWFFFACLSMGLAARFVMFIIIVILLLKNEEAFQTQ